MRHLDPRPRTSRSLTRERSSTPLPPQPAPVEPPRAEPDPLASAVAQAVIDLFADSSDHPPFPGFESSRASPDYQPCPDSPRHRFDDDGYGHEYSMGPIALGPVHPAGPYHRTPAVGAPPDPPAGIRCAPWFRSLKLAWDRPWTAWHRPSSLSSTSGRPRPSHPEPRRYRTTTLPPAGVTTRMRRKPPVTRRRTLAPTLTVVSKRRLGRRTRKASMATPMTPPADEYDPLNPELSIPPEFLHDFFLVPDEAIVYNDYIDFLGNELDTADFEWGTHRGCNTCKPIRWSTEIERFLRQAARVTSKPDDSESRT